MSNPRRDLSSAAIARLDPSRERQSFDCGNLTLNRYLNSIATQDLKRGLAVPYVLTLAPAKEVIGYFTLAATSIDLSELPAPVRRRLPAGVVIGASLLGRLAVDRRYQGEGLAGLMVVAAAKMSFTQSPLGCVAMIVDAIDSAAAEFYRHLGFIKAPEGPRRLFLLRESLAKLL